MHQQTALPDHAADAFSVRDQVVIVTGVSGNIGPRIARIFAANGAHVIASDLPGPQLDAAAQKLKTFGDVTAAAADLTKPEDLRGLIDAAQQRYGRLNALVCCGAIGKSDELDYEKDENFDRLFHTNLRANWLLVRYARALMEQSGPGSIVAISSINGHRAMFPCSLYAATKSGLQAMCRELSVELAPQGLRINTVSPGSVPDPERHIEHMSNRLHESYRQQYFDMAAPLMDVHGRDSQPLKVSARGEDIAMACLYLASPAARFITGTDILVDGGMLQDYGPHFRRREYREREQNDPWQTMRQWLSNLPDEAWIEGPPHWLQRRRQKDSQ